MPFSPSLTVMWFFVLFRTLYLMQMIKRCVLWNAGMMGIFFNVYFSLRTKYPFWRGFKTLDLSHSCSLLLLLEFWQKMNHELQNAFLLPEFHCLVDLEWNTCYVFQFWKLFMSASNSKHRCALILLCCSALSCLAELQTECSVMKLWWIYTYEYM